MNETLVPTVPGAVTEDSPVTVAVEAVVKLRAESNTKALMADWGVGKILNELDKSYGSKVLQKAVEQLSKLDGGDTISTASAYRYRRLHSFYDGVQILKLADAGISTSQAVDATRIDGFKVELAMTTAERISKKEIGRSAFAKTIGDALAGAGTGAVDVDPAAEDTGSRKGKAAKKAPSTASADTVALDDQAPPLPAEKPKRGRKAKEPQLTVREERSEVGVNDPLDVMAKKAVRGLEDAVRTMGDILIVADKLGQADPTLASSVAGDIRRVQQKMADLITAGAKAKEAIFEFEVKETP